MKIKEQLGKKVQSDFVQPRDHNVQRSTTSVIAEAQDAPTKAELMKRSPKMIRFHDAIMEEVPTSDERISEVVTDPSYASNIGISTSGPPHASNFGPPNTGPPQPAPMGPETFCTTCGNRVTSEETHCSYCKNPVSFPPPTSSILPPPIVSTETGLVRMGSDEPKPKPLRASAASTEQAIQHHRRTQAFPAAIQDPRGGNLGAVGGASGGGETGAPIGTSAARGQGGAEGSTSSGVPGGAPSYEKSYKDIMAEKLEYWKTEWRKRGYSDDEIPAEPGSVPLPPPKEKKPPQPPPSQASPSQPSSSQPKKRPKKHYGQSKSTTDELERYRIEQQRKEQMARLAEEGQSFMECIKVCSTTPLCGLLPQCQSMLWPSVSLSGGCTP